MKRNMYGAMITNYKSLILAISLFFALSAPISAAPGDLDPTFGNGGIAFGWAPGYQLYVASAMAIQPDGKIVVVGLGAGPSTSGHWASAVVRFNPNGSLDTSFGGTGIVINPISHWGFSSVAIQPDGKIVVVGVGGAIGTFGVVRYNSNGSLDSSFNGSGIVLTPVFSDGGPNSVTIQPDSKIVVFGFGSSQNGTTAIVRYNPNGSLDTSFNGSGIVFTPVGAANSVVIQADGKIIAGGASSIGSGISLVRYNADGSLDTSFNGTGIVNTPVGDAASGVDLAIQPDGKIVVAGSGLVNQGGFIFGSFAVVRYYPDGSVDTSFGSTGKTLIPMGYASSVAIQTNGKIVVGGNTATGDFAVARLNPNGSLDTSFNGTGTVITPFGASDFSGYVQGGYVAIQADGKIVIAGDYGNDTFRTFVAVRYQGDSISPTSCRNPIDCAEFFVRQHYLDFLNREPDPAGFAGWQAVLNNCLPGDTSCDPIHVSGAFFQSPEFQQRGYFVYRFYSVAFGRKPDYEEFRPDLAKVSGFLSDAELETAKLNFIAEFMNRPAFVTRFNGLDNTQYVDTLLSTSGISHPSRDSWIAELTNGSRTRAQVLRDIAESTEVYHKYYNQAFVVMQYFGYLRRQPDALYLNWIAHLDATGDYRSMINGFVNSLEYRGRFGP